MEPAQIQLLDAIEDRRSSPMRAIAIFSPVGDLAQLEGFCAHARFLGLDKDADFIFVYRQGLKYGAKGFSALHASEKYPLGTSGAFFAGQLLAHSLGYETIVVADLDAFLDCRHTFDALVKLSGEKGAVAVPLSKSPQEKQAQKEYFVINQWGVFPRSVFEQCGFAIPYTYKGAEDFELKQRLLSRKMLFAYPGGFATHPKEGMGVFAKFANRRKYFPYISGIMKAYLFCSQYSPFAYAKYLLWNSYYCFFADALAEKSLQPILFSPFDVRMLNCLDAQEPAFTFEKLEGKPPAGALSQVFSLFSLLLFKSASAGDCKLALRKSRVWLALSMLRASILLPVRFLQGIFSLFSQRKKAGHFIFPIYPKNAQSAMEDYIALLRS